MRTASALPSWRGRVAYAWASAAAYLLYAADAVLLTTNYDSYPLEKVDFALDQLRNGCIEGSRCGLSLNPDFMQWLRRLTKARY